MAIIEYYLDLMIEQDASDLHLSAGHKPRLRRDGGLIVLDQEPILTSQAIFGLISAMAPEYAVQDLKTHHDADFSYTQANGTARFRVNVFTDRKGVGLVARAIKSQIPTLEELGMPADLTTFCELNKGLFIVTGPTGSGKSTTLAAMVDYINTHRSDHIVTIEDPIEYVHESKKCLVNQREVPQQASSFARALRASLREDPDVVLVGEMRDLETIETALETAETGHLVLGTLHTTTAYTAPDRIINVFPPERQAQIRTMLAGTLRGVLSQTLCKKSGSGRVASTELLVVTDAVANMIREGKMHQIPSLMQSGRAYGMHLMEDSLARLVADGAIDPAEAMHNANDKLLLRERFEKMGINEATPPMVRPMVAVEKKYFDGDEPNWLTDE